MDAKQGVAVTYAFCECAYASGVSRWHIRRLTEAGYKLGGGADTLSLCGKKVSWDLKVTITAYHLEKNACLVCRKVYVQAKGGI